MADETPITNIIPDDGVPQPSFTFSLSSQRPIRFTYKNYRGEIAERHAHIRFIWFGATQYHPHDQWLINANDLDRKGTPEREFAMNDMSNVRFAT